MKQRVRTVSYLAKAEFGFKSGVYDLVALPSGAEVVKVSLETVGDFSSGVTGNVYVGFKGENQRDYFLSLNASAESCSTSTQDYTAVSNKVIVAEVTQNQASPSTNNVKCVLRVLYFLPSETEVEY